MDLNDIIEAFEARPIEWIDRAADQDGWDGGWIATNETSEAWGETVDEARKALGAEGEGWEGEAGGDYYR
jgi:hypothetical protein